MSPPVDYKGYFVSQGMNCGEACFTYPMVAERDIALYDAAGGTKIVHVMAPGERAEPDDIVDHFMPIRIDVIKPHTMRACVLNGRDCLLVRKLQPGDRFFVLRNLGEGSWAVWLKGKPWNLDDVEEWTLDFIDGITASNCQTDLPGCWYTVRADDQFLRTHRWIRLKTEGGKTGWTDRYSFFCINDLGSLDPGYEEECKNVDQSLARKQKRYPVEYQTIP